MDRPRVAGVTVPLFSLRTRRDWGIGQIDDLPLCADWAIRAGLKLVQILPPHELSDGESSPYGALTAFGIDPIYIGIDAIADLDKSAIDEVLGEEGARELEAVRALPEVDYKRVRALKKRALNAAFKRFFEREWQRETPRAKELSAFLDKERSWVDDLALYTVFRETHEGYGWESWPLEERDRHPEALSAARKTYATRVLEVAYGQWIALAQWDAARASMRERGVALMGDLPFVVTSESADVWSRASQFQRHMSLGAPPDAFSAEGQDWGLPPYDWRAMDQDGLSWVRARSRQAARLYERFRIDHVVGFFRQWIKPGGSQERGHFDPDGDDAQRERGKTVLRAIAEEAGHEAVIAEDLGVIPPFVRETLRELGIPGYRVIPWEKDDNRFRDPLAFPKLSVATWSTHDTAPITAWWDDFEPYERTAIATIAGMDEGASPEARTLKLLDLLMRSGSDLTLVLAQEILDARDRINLPGTVGAANWTYRIPRPLEDLLSDEGHNAHLAEVQRIVSASGR